MRQIVNTEQSEAWNGYEGTHWADNHDRWNAVVSGINDELFAAAGIGEGDRVLDVGCGVGQTTRRAARAARHGEVLGLDLSGPMLTRARAIAAEEGIANVRFEQGDAEVHPFPEVDVALSRGGIMFFADPVAAFANIGRALRPGEPRPGKPRDKRLVFACPRAMDENEWFTVPMKALLGHEPKQPSGPYAPGMFSLADPGRVEEVLTSAGFAEVSMRPVETRMIYGADPADAAAFILGSGPVRFNLRDAGPDAIGETRDRLIAALRPHQTAGDVRMRGAWWVVTALRR